MVKRNQSSLGIDLSDKTLNFCAMNPTPRVVGVKARHPFRAGTAGLCRGPGEP